MRYTARSRSQGGWLRDQYNSEINSDLGLIGIGMKRFEINIFCCKVNILYSVTLQDIDYE